MKDNHAYYKKVISDFEATHFEYETEIDSITVEIVNENDTHVIANVTVEEVSGDRTMIDEGEYPKELFA
jgi:hypothetical protein